MNKEKSQKLKQEALAKLDKLITGYIDEEVDNADKLSYWLRDYANYLDFEKSFVPRRNKRYKRGEIVKVDLGYNIGSEEGGRHYCAILDKNNSQASPVVTVVPLTSVKKEKQKQLPCGSVYIGTEIYDTLKEKSDNELNAAKKDFEVISDEVTDGKKLAELSVALEELNERLGKIRKIQDEISRMKKGSIALVSQITTISKIRIIDPKKNSDVLSGIRLKPQTLDLIDNELKSLYIKS